MNDPNWMRVKRPVVGAGQLFYDPARCIIKSVQRESYTKFPVTRYRWAHCKTWVKRIQDLGPSEPDYSI